jgi:hypothetical protein
MDKAPAYGAGDSGFESQYGLLSFSLRHLSFFLCQLGSFCCPLFRPKRLSIMRSDSVSIEEKKAPQKEGVMRESNSRPPAPEAGIIPLDQSPRGRTLPARLAPKRKGRAGVEPATYRAATNCSTTELTPRRRSYWYRHPPRNWFV